MYVRLRVNVSVWVRSSATRDSCVRVPGVAAVVSCDGWTDAMARANGRLGKQNNLHHWLAARLLPLPSSSFVALLLVVF
jgi:hypothetical protein